MPETSTRGGFVFFTYECPKNLFRAFICPGIIASQFKFKSMFNSIKSYFKVLTNDELEINEFREDKQLDGDVGRLLREKLKFTI
jgi:hypothetical protein